jgi:hypothetical protein
MIDVVGIAWLAGLLEGEASFGYYKGCPTIQLQMTDEDVINRVAALTGARIKKPWRPKGKPTYKLVHQCGIRGMRAIEWMQTILVFMGERRRAKIVEIVAAWKTSTYKPRAPKGTPRPAAPCHPDRPLCAKNKCKQYYRADYHQRYRAAHPGKRALKAAAKKMELSA